MKKFTKFLSVFMTAIMTLGMLLPNMAFAAEQKTTDKVTLHKLLMTEKELAKWNSDEVEIGKNGNGYDGTQDLVGLNNILKAMDQKEVTEIPNVFFAIKDVKTGRYVKADGRTLLPAEFELTEETKNRVLGGLTTENGLEIPTKMLPQTEPTEYEIVEILDLSTYVGPKGETLTDSLAVPVKITLPFVNEDGIQKEVHVYPKNTENKPEIDKNYADGTETDANDDVNTEDIASPGAQYPNYGKDKNTITRQIGDVVPYDVKTKIPADVHYKTLRWEDTMSKGLTYNIGSLVVKDITDDYVFVGGVENDKKIKDYIIKENQSGFVIEFTEQGLVNIEKITKGKEIEIQLTYDATINTDAVTDKVDENEIIFNYSNNPKEFNEPRDNEVKPFDKEIHVKKFWDDKGDENAHKGIEVTYYLYEKGATAADDKVVDMVVLDSDKGFNYVFTGLDAEKTYYVKETVSVGFGFDPAYTVNNNAGKVTIKNTKDETNPTPLIPTHPKVVTHGKKFVKTNNEEATSDALERLAGAEFVITNKAGDKYLQVKSNATIIEEQADVKAAKEALDKAVTDYNEKNAKYVDAKAAYDKAKEVYDNNEVKGKGTEAELKAMKKAELAMNAAKDAMDAAKSTVDEKQVAYNKAFIAARTTYVWTTDINEAYVLVSDVNGQFEITGLDAGSYNLVETKAPEGFAIDKTPKPFEVGMGSYENGNIDYEVSDKDTENDDALQVINKKMTIPQTGGIGTAIFVIAGIALMGGAFVAMKRQEA